MREVSEKQPMILNKLRVFKMRSNEKTANCSQLFQIKLKTFPWLPVGKGFHKQGLRSITVGKRKFN